MCRGDAVRHGKAARTGGKCTKKRNACKTPSPSLPNISLKASFKTFKTKTVRFAEVGGAGISAPRLVGQAAQDRELQSSSANVAHLLLGAVVAGRTSV